MFGLGVVRLGVLVCEVGTRWFWMDAWRLI